MLKREEKIEVVRKISFPNKVEVIPEAETKVERDNVWNIFYAGLTYMFVPTITHAQDDKLEKLSDGFRQIYEVISIICEPILMIIFIYGFILYAIDSKGRGLIRIKQASLAFLGITLLPSIFEMLRWIGGMLGDIF